MNAFESRRNVSSVALTPVQELLNQRVLIVILNEANLSEVNIFRNQEQFFLIVIFCVAQIQPFKFTISLSLSSENRGIDWKRLEVGSKMKLPI